MPKEAVKPFYLLVLLREIMERETGIEPATNGLEGRMLDPRNVSICSNMLSI